MSNIVAICCLVKLEVLIMLVDRIVRQMHVAVLQVTRKWAFVSLGR